MYNSLRYLVVLQLKEHNVTQVTEEGKSITSISPGLQQGSGLEWTHGRNERWLHH